MYAMSVSKIFASPHRDGNHTETVWLGVIMTSNVALTTCVNGVHEMRGVCNVFMTDSAEP